MEKADVQYLSKNHIIVDPVNGAEVQEPVKRLSKRFPKVKKDIILKVLITCENEEEAISKLTSGDGTREALQQWDTVKGSRKGKPYSATRTGKVKKGQDSQDPQGPQGSPLNSSPSTTHRPIANGVLENGSNGNISQADVIHSDSKINGHSDPVLVDQINKVEVLLNGTVSPPPPQTKEELPDIPSQVGEERDNKAGSQSSSDTRQSAPPLPQRKRNRKSKHVSSTTDQITRKSPTPIPSQTKGQNLKESLEDEQKQAVEKQENGKQVEKQEEQQEAEKPEDRKQEAEKPEDSKQEVKRHAPIKQSERKKIDKSNNLSHKTKKQNSNMKHETGQSSKTAVTTKIVPTAEIDVLKKNDLARGRLDSNSSTGSNDSTKRLTKDLTRCHVSLSRHQTNLHERCDASSRLIHLIFSQLQSRLKDREEYLISQLEEVRRNANKVLEDRKETSGKLKAQSEAISHLRETEATHLKAQMKAFITDKKVDEEIGSVSRFRGSPDDLMEQITNFGEIVDLSHTYTNWYPRQVVVSSAILASLSPPATVPLESSSSQQTATGQKQAKDTSQQSDVAHTDATVDPHDLRAKQERVKDSLMNQGVFLFPPGGQSPPTKPDGKPTQDQTRRGKQRKLKEKKTVEGGEIKPKTSSEGKQARKTKSPNEETKSASKDDATVPKNVTKKDAAIKKDSASVSKTTTDDSDRQDTKSASNVFSQRKKRHYYEESVIIIHERVKQKPLKGQKSAPSQQQNRQKKNSTRNFRPHQKPLENGGSTEQPTKEAGTGSSATVNQSNDPVPSAERKNQGPSNDDNQSNIGIEQKPTSSNLETSDSDIKQLIFEDSDNSPFNSDTGDPNPQPVQSQSRVSRKQSLLIVPTKEMEGEESEETFQLKIAAHES